MQLVEKNTPASLLGLVCVFLFALAVRGLGFEQVISEDMVLFAPSDAMYHLRRSFYSFVNFPAPLLWDPLLNYPDGAPVPWPPLFDLVLGGVARLFASDQRGFEIVAAWISPFYGALTTLPIFLIGRQVASTGIGLGAALLFALFPICVTYGRVGNPDHHAAVALVGAWLLWICLVLVDRRTGRDRLLHYLPILLLIRLAVLLIWHGNLLYLVLLEATLLLPAVYGANTRLLKVHFLSAMGTAILLMLILESLPIPIGGPFSSISLSRLHLLLVTDSVILSGSVLLLERFRPGRSFPVRMAFMVACGLSFLALMFSFPEPRAGLEPALRFATLRDGVGHITTEQFPLFAFGGREVVTPATRPWGYLYLLIPVAPFGLIFLTPKPRRHSGTWVVAAWCAVLGILAITQRRYGNDLGPSLAVAFAVLFSEVPQRILRRSSLDVRFALPASAMLFLALLAPAISNGYLPRLGGSWRALRGDASAWVKPEQTVVGTLIQFGRDVRRVTPETLGFIDADQVPRYGILAEANVGHVLHYVSRKGTATDPMWAFIGPKNWETSHDFLRVSREMDALVLAKRLRGRYVFTMDSRNPPGVVGRLHRSDGVAVKSGELPLEHFRLITEAPRGAPSLLDLFDDAKTGRRGKRSEAVPYKLFEIVKGAVIEVFAAPGSRVEVSVRVETPSKRSFVYRAHGRASPEGVAKIRVPYATDGGKPAGPREPYHVRSGSREARRHVPERAVRLGESVEVSFADVRGSI